MKIDIPMVSTNLPSFFYPNPANNQVVKKHSPHYEFT